MKLSDSEKLMAYCILMFIIIIGTLTLFSISANADDSVEYKTCSFESKEIGKIKYRSETREKAFELVARACLAARTAQYTQIRGSVPSIERRILFAEDCVNNTLCKH